MADIRLRAATKKDLPVLMQMESECFPEALYDNARFSRKDYLHCIKAPSNRVAIALDKDDKIVGCLAIEFLEGNEPVAHLTSMAIRPEARRRGFGRELLSQAEAIVQDKGIGVMTLVVSEKNEVALKLYRDLGYIYKAVSEFAYADGTTALEFEKALQATPARPVLDNSNPSAKYQPE